MAKLHELLAVEKDRAAVAASMMAEATKVFAAGTHFHGHVKTWQFFDAARAMENRTEQKKVDETVPGKLAWVGKHLVKFLDLRYQIDLANCDARADLVVDGVVVAGKVPVSYLLMLESRLASLREVYKAIPTQQPGIDWRADKEQAEAGDVFRAATPQIEFLTEKKVMHEVVVPATEHHPAQVASHNKDERVGKTEVTRYSSMVTPADKAEMLARLDTLIAAAKRARQRANTVTAPKEKIASALLAYVNTGEAPKGSAATPEDAAEI